MDKKAIKMLKQQEHIQEHLAGLSKEIQDGVSKYRNSFDYASDLCGYRDVTPLKALANECHKTGHICTLLECPYVPMAQKLLYYNEEV